LKSGKKGREEREEIHEIFEMLDFLDKKVIHTETYINNRKRKEKKGLPKSPR